jgi:hypothetical protein
MLNDAARLLKRRSVMTAMAMILRYRSFEGQLKKAGIYGKEHDVKRDWLGEKAPISMYDLCGCRDGQVVIRAHGCKGSIVAITKCSWT